MRRLALAAALCASLAAPAAAQWPNERAIVARFPVPGHGDGFTPQGLTLLDGNILLGGYLWPLPGKAACRVYLLSPAGATLAMRDVPAACEHGGGLANAGGRLFLADTHRLIELDPAGLADPAKPLVRREWPMTQPVVGAFAAGRPGALWLGRFRSEGPATMERYSLAALDGLPAGAPLTIALSEASLPVPPRTQGAAFAPDGTLWTSQSNQSLGMLTKQDPQTGATQDSWDVPKAIEDIAVAADGHVWASSESGTRRWPGGVYPFPFVFRVDPKLLR